MINRINFRMDNVLSIPIYSDWSKLKFINYDLEDVLVLSGGVTLSADIAMSEMNLRYVIFVDNGVDFERIDQDIDNINNAMAFDLYRRVMQIGYVDPLKLKEIDPWTSIHGIPVELRLGVGIFNDSNASTGLTIHANDSLGVALFKHFDMVFGDSYKIANSNLVPTIPDIGLEISHAIPHVVPQNLQFNSVDQTLTGTRYANIILSGDTELTNAVNLQSNYGSGMVLTNALIERLTPEVGLGNVPSALSINSSVSDKPTAQAGLGDIAHTITADGETELRFGVRVIEDSSGEISLVLQAYDDVETDVSVEEDEEEEPEVSPEG